jgi:hypothetical protein
MSNLNKQLNLLTGVILALMIIIVLSPGFYLWWPEDFAFYPPHELLENRGGTEALAIWQQALVFLLLEWPAVILCIGLWHLLALIGLIKKGQWFEQACEDHCRKFGRQMAWLILAQILHRTLIVLVITATYPAGKRELMLAFSSNDLFAALPALFALVFAHLVALGRAQREELKQIV